MAWNPPSAFATGAILTAAQMNQVRESLLYLHGDAGAIALSSPVQAPLQDTGSICRAQVFAKQGVGGVATVLIPDGAGDVTTFIGGVATIRSTDNLIVQTASINLLPDGASANIYNTGGDTFVLTAAVNGQVTVSRSAGAKTYDVLAWLLWL